MYPTTLLAYYRRTIIYYFYWSNLDYNYFFLMLNVLGENILSSSILLNNYDFF